MGSHPKSATASPSVCGPWKTIGKRSVAKAFKGPESAAACDEITLFLIQDLSQFLREFLQFEGFLDKPVAAAVYDLPGRTVDTVSA